MTRFWHFQSAQFRIVLLTILPVALLVIFSTTIVHAKEFYFKENHYLLNAKTQYYNTSTNFNDAGNLATLGGSNYFDQWLITPGVIYGISNYFSAFADLNITYAGSVGGGNKRTSTNLQDVHLGGSLLLPYDLFDFISELFVTIPTYSISPDTDAVLTGEGSTDIDGRVYVQKKISRMQLQGYLGYVIRSGGRAGLAPWGAEAQLFFKSFVVGGGVNGFYSITDDQYVKNPSQRYATSARVNGGSLKYYSVNPNDLDAIGWARFAVSDKADVRVGGSYSLLGTRYASGWSVYVDILLDLDRDDFHSKTEAAPAAKFKKNTSDGFRIQQDTQHEEDLFLDNVNSPKKLKQKKKYDDRSSEKSNDEFEIMDQEQKNSAVGVKINKLNRTAKPKKKKKTNSN